ncbi:hypothetical protein M426DRAFT_326136 [Hypoxylon sp. CI-4A]|nr:hypothetical protein M426DRAFT_326136 [Hypoxylon sp. CI-4A]
MPPRKRTATEAAAAPETGGNSRRRSGRISSSGKKSTYFETNGDDNDGFDEDLPPRKIAKTQAKGRKAKKEESIDELQDEGDEYQDGSEDGDEDKDDGSVEKDESSEGYESEKTPPPRQKRSRGRPSKSQAGTPASTKKSAPKLAKTPKATPKAKTKAKPKVKAKAKAKAKDESEEPEANEDGDENEDEDGDIIEFIPSVELRDDGGVEYEDTRVHKNTLLFLKDLKANNKRNWLKANDEEYRRSLKDWESFVETLTEKIVEADYTIPELPIKDVIFRIYRDIRFSKDPTPYKPHYSAAWSRTGRKGPYACYYVHIEPGRCMVGGGLWHPEAESLARLRASIDERPHRIRRVLLNPAFRKTFLPTAKPNEKAVVSAFAAANKENALKTKPKGFNPEHRDIELLKLRNFTIGKKIPDEDILAEDAQDRVMSIISAMVEFVSFLNSVVKPDPNADSDSDEPEDGAEEDEQDDEEVEEASD